MLETLESSWPPLRLLLHSVCTHTSLSSFSFGLCQEFEDFLKDDESDVATVIEAVAAAGDVDLFGESQQLGPLQEGRTVKKVARE